MRQELANLRTPCACGNAIASACFLGQQPASADVKTLSQNQKAWSPPFSEASRKQWGTPWGSVPAGDRDDAATVCRPTSACVSPIRSISASTCATSQLIWAMFSRQLPEGFQLLCERRGPPAAPISTCGNSAPPETRGGARCDVPSSGIELDAGLSAGTQGAIPSNNPLRTTGGGTDVRTRCRLAVASACKSTCRLTPPQTKAWAKSQQQMDPDRKLFLGHSQTPEHHARQLPSCLSRTPD